MTTRWMMDNTINIKPPEMSMLALPIWACYHFVSMLFVKHFNSVSQRALYIYY